MVSLPVKFIIKVKKFIYQMKNLTSVLKLTSGVASCIQGLYIRREAKANHPPSSIRRKNSKEHKNTIKVTIKFKITFFS